MRPIVACAAFVVAWLVLGAGPAMASPRALIKSLDGKHRATVADGVKVVALIAGVSTGKESYKQAHRALVRATVIDPEDATDAPAPLTRGLAAYMFFRAMSMKGGWISRIFGPTTRYAYKHFVAIGLLPEDGEGSPMTGDDLIALLKLIAVYQKRGRV